MCLEKDPSFDQLNENCEYLNTYYVETRYPVHWPTHFSQEETYKSFQAANKIQSFIKEKLDWK